MNLLSQHHCANEDDMLALGASLSRIITAGSVVHLIGELGAGKTTLVRGFLQGLGFSGAVKSPTFTIVEPYDLIQLKIYHFDLYRLDSPQELEMLGIREMLSRDSIVFFEWPQKGGNFLVKADFLININIVESARQIFLFTND